MLEELHHCMCSILHVPKKMHHCIVLDIACARRNASYDVLDIACARRNASPHCARDCIVLEICISSRLHRARSLHVPESNQVISINRCQKQIRSLYSLFIFQRRHSLKASSSWPADIISWPKGLISVYHNPKVS